MPGRTKTKTEPRRVDLSSNRTDAAAAAAARRDPWGSMQRFIDAHGYACSDDGWGQKTCKIDVQHGTSRATLDVQFRRLFTGDLLRVDVTSTVVAPKANDPPSGFDAALSMSFKRNDARECGGHVNVISKKPTHGVRSGSDALGIAIALGRLFGCAALELQDASSLPCPGAAGGRVALRNARILSRGAGWYESKGFRSLVEALEPGRFKGTVGRLHAIPLKDMLRALRDVDAAARAALCGGDSNKGVRIAKYKKDAAMPGVTEKPSTSEVVAVLQRASTALEALEALELGNNGTTLGDAVDRLLKRDCAASDRLVEALLPGSETFDVLLSDPDGKPVEPWPKLEAWVFAWRLLSAYGGELRLKL